MILTNIYREKVLTSHSLQSACRFAPVGDNIIIAICIRYIHSSNCSVIYIYTHIDLGLEEQEVIGRAKVGNTISKI